MYETMRPGDKKKDPTTWTPHVKLVLYGREGAGKSALMLRYVYGRFDTELESTIGAAYNAKKILVDGYNVNLQIWDTAGSERFNSIAPIYIRGAKVVLMCFELPDVKEIASKIARIKEIADKSRIFLVATKMDLPSELSYEDVANYAKMHGYELFYTSAMSGHGVNELFTKASKVGLELSFDDEDQPRVHNLEVAEKKKSSTCCW